MTFKLNRRTRDYINSIVILIFAVLTQYLVITVGNIPVPGILYPMAFLIAWYYGFGPALMAVTLSLFCSNLLFYEPRLTFKILHFSDYIRLFIFAFTSIIAAWIVAKGRRAQLGETQAKVDLKESLEVLETINRVGKNMSAELDHKKLVQHLTDAGTHLTRAEFGAFYYYVEVKDGHILTLYAASGMSIAELSKFPIPSDFLSQGVIRSDDKTKNHLPVTSYLAIPVKSRTGEVLGGLFFGSMKSGVFTERDELMIVGLASQAAIAMDNARLFDKSTRAILIRDEFLSISSHELRTPLTPLKIQLQAIIKQLDKGSLPDAAAVEQFKKMLGMAEKQVNRITVLVDDLLDVTRITSGRLTLNIEESDLVESIRELSERYKTQLQAANCELHLSTPEILLARVDKIRFEQVLVNLLTNAIKYAPGKPITITLMKADQQAIVQMSDQGAGILLEDQSRVFERFERANSHAAQGGLGLGLYIVKQIISAHNGTIEMQSLKDKGTTFTIKLPLK